MEQTAQKAFANGLYLHSSFPAADSDLSRRLVFCPRVWTRLGVPKD